MTIRRPYAVNLGERKTIHWMFRSATKRALKPVAVWTKEIAGQYFCALCRAASYLGSRRPDADSTSLAEGARMLSPAQNHFIEERGKSTANLPPTR